MLALLSLKCYKVSWRKAQISREKVKYCGFIISKGHWTLGLEEKQDIYATLWPNTKNESKNFLGLQDLQNTSRIVEFLYVTTPGPAKAPLD